MNRLPDKQKQLPLRPENHRARIIHISIRPRTWFGKFVLAAISIAAIVAALFLSIIVLAFVFAVLMVVIVYSLWIAYRVRRSALKYQRDERRSKER